MDEKNFFDGKPPMPLSSIAGDKDRHISLLMAINVKNLGGIHTPDTGQITH
jgi:hypothetical protein